jgi:hypothetical protein
VIALFEAFLNQLDLKIVLGLNEFISDQKFPQFGIDYQRLSFIGMGFFKGRNFQIVNLGSN